jgi:cardiolipin synthase A/B
VPNLPLHLHVASVVGFVLALIVLSRELRERRAPSATFAWFLVMALVPYAGVPLYLVFGGRKRRQRAASKRPVYPTGPAPAAPETPMDRLLDGMGVPPVSSNRSIELLADGESAYAAVLDLIDRAEHHVDIATFILGGDAVGDAVLAHLTEKAKAGVRVRLLIDGLFALRPHRRSLAALRKAGGRIAEFMPLLHVPFRGRSNLRNHRKIAVADGERAIIGGMNLAEEYMGPVPLPTRWKDVALRVEGPAVRDLDALFEADWTFAAGAPPALPPAPAPAPVPVPVPVPAGPPRSLVPIRIVASGPDVATDTLYDAILFCLYTAQSRIWIATPYFVPDEAIVCGLSLACRRGVDVRIIVPTPSNHPITDLAGAPSLRSLQSDGASIFPYVSGMLHAKVIVIDDAVAMVGSANFDMRSLFLNYEVMGLLYGKPEIDAMASWFEATAATCQRSFKEAGRVRAAAEDVARLLGPLV